MGYFNGLEYIISAVVIVAELICFVQISDAFLDRKKNKITFMSAGAFWLIISFIVYNFAQLNPILKIAVSILNLFVYFLIIYNGKYYMKLFAAVLANAILLGISFTMQILLMRIFEKTNIQVFESPSFFIFGAFINYSVTFAVSYLIKKYFIYKRTGVSVTLKQLLAFLLFTLSTVFTIVLLLVTEVQSDNPSLIFVFDALLLLMANLSIVFVLEKIDKDNIVKTENQLLKLKIQNTKSHLEEIEAMYKLQRRFSHEFKNHLLAINGFSSNKDLDGLNEYLSKLNGVSESHGTIIETGNAVLNIILNNKYYQARDKGVVMEFCLVKKIDVPISIEEFVVLVSNILENAINASAKSEQKRVLVNLSGKGEQTILSVKNTCKETVKIKDNKIIFENNDLLHGYGLQNIYAIFKKHQCDYFMDYSDGWFKFAVIFKPAHLGTEI